MSGFAELLNFVKKFDIIKPDLMLRACHPDLSGGERGEILNPRVFSLEEANALIPKLDGLATHLLKKKEEMQKKHDQLLILDLIAGEKIHDLNSKDAKEYLQKSAELEALVLSFEDDILEINRMGCYLRDINRGVVDFFSIRKNELIYLNWQRGEAKILFYHDVDAHFTRRKPIDGFKEETA